MVTLPNMFTPTDLAQTDEDIREYKRRFTQIFEANLDAINEAHRMQVGAHIAFAALDYGITAYADHIRSQGIFITCERKETEIVVSLGTLSVIYSLPLRDTAVSVTYVRNEPTRRTILHQMRWSPPEQEKIRDHIRSFANDMRSFLLNSTVPT